MKPKRTAIDQQTVTLIVAAVGSLLWEFRHLSSWLRVVTLDALSCYIPWYADLVSMGRFRGISGAYANYTPPTLYLFSVASFLQGHHSSAVLLKLINLPFIIASGVLAYWIACALNASRTRAAATGFLVATLPELWQNAFHWGQYDIIFTTFLLAMAWALLSQRAGLAMFLFGSAIAFKLQAIFAAPVLLALFLGGELPLYSLLLVPLAYLAWMVPAALAGRSWLELLTVYRRQYDLVPQLSVDAPNFYLMLQPYVPQSGMTSAMRIALLFAAASCCWLAYRLWKAPHSGQTKDRLILAFALSQALAAYLLPRMHERYFFSAGVFAAVLLSKCSRAIWPVVLFQAAAMLTYHQYFRTAGFDTSRSLFVLPFFCLSAAIVLLILQFVADTRPNSNGESVSA